VVAVSREQEGDVVDVDHQAVQGAAQRRLASKFVLRGHDGIAGAAQLGYELLPSERRQHGIPGLSVAHDDLATEPRARRRRARSLLARADMIAGPAHFDPRSRDESAD
jgi:hypothetical protein